MKKQKFIMVINLSVLKQRITCCITQRYRSVSTVPSDSYVWKKNE